MSGHRSAVNTGSPSLGTLADRRAPLPGSLAAADPLPADKRPNTAKAQHDKMKAIREATNEKRGTDYLRPQTPEEAQSLTDDDMRWLAVAECGARIDEPGYDTNCGMMPKAEWSAMALQLISTDWVARMYVNPGGTLKAKLTPTVSVTKPDTAIQSLKNLTATADALEAIAAAKAPVQADEITTLWNAILAHLGKPTAEPVDLGNDYSLAFSKLTACLRHPGNRNSLVVGSQLTDDEPMRPVFRREELRGFVEKVKTGPKELGHPALKTVNTPTIQATVAASEPTRAADKRGGKVTVVDTHAAAEEWHRALAASWERVRGENITPFLLSRKAFAGEYGL